MAKNLKLNIKNTQIAEAINLSGLKGKLAKKKEETSSSEALAPKEISPKTSKPESEEVPSEAPKIKARSKSAFAESPLDASTVHLESSQVVTEDEVTPVEKKPNLLEMTHSLGEDEPIIQKTSEELRREIFGDSDLKESTSAPAHAPEKTPPTTPPETIEVPVQEVEIPVKAAPPLVPPPVEEPKRDKREFQTPPPPSTPPRERLGPTGRHMRDFVKPKPPTESKPAEKSAPKSSSAHPVKSFSEDDAKDKLKASKSKIDQKDEPKEAETEAVKGNKAAKFKEFRDVKPAKKQETKQFDARDRQGLRSTDEDQLWRRRKSKSGKSSHIQEDLTIRPTSLKVRLPISIKDLASDMKLKASQLVGKLFLQGLVVTLNDILDDETTVQLLGQEFGCEISIDTAEAKRIQITDKSIKEELSQTPSEQLELRPPVVAFMGHVDHGKTTLIDTIRSSNRAAGEAGAITQHIGAFRCTTKVGDIAILDTPGHEAFSAMRARGADVTDIVVLVVAGDEGLRQQTIEAIQHAKAAGVIIVVAINKMDKPNFNAETVYRQLAEQELLPESWGGQTITVNCSAVTGEGVETLLEMLALQAEVLELRADPHSRARGTVLESEMHKGMGAVATVLVQNGTLRKGDALVFDKYWGRVKTMHDEFRHELQEASPSTPVEITGLSGLPEAGQEFIVVKSEKEAKEIAAARTEGARQTSMLLQQKRKVLAENLFQQAAGSEKKILNIVLRADVQGSLEALKSALMKIESSKVDLNIIFAGVGEISESDVQLAAASKAVILGFHTQIESHAEPIVKQLGVPVRLHDIIYHAVDDITDIMSGLLDKIAQETEKGKAVVKATFKSSHAGVIAGCQVSEGVIQRNNHVRIRRNNEVIWKGSISSLKRVKEDVREVTKGLECGILLNNFSQVQEGDIIEAYEITYISQEL